MKNTSHEFLQQKLAEPFLAPRTFGRLQWWRDESPHSLVSAAVVVTVLAVMMLLWTLVRPLITGEAGKPGTAEVKIEQVVLGAPSGDAAVLDDSVVAEQRQNSTATPAARPVDVVKQVDVPKPVGTTEAATTSDAPVVDAKQAQQAKATASKLSDTIKELERQALPPGGRPQLVGMNGLSGLFKVDAKVKSVVFVLDKSGSMSGLPIEAVKAELVHGISALKEEQRFGVIFFDDFAWPMLSPAGRMVTGQGNGGFQLLNATAENKRKVQSWVAQMFGGGGTNPVPAMDLAIQAKPDLIVLLSDGEFHPSSVEVITQQNHKVRGAKKGVINCVGLAERIQTLFDIAGQNGPGIYYAARLQP